MENILLYESHQMYSIHSSETMQEYTWEKNCVVFVFFLPIL